MPAWLELGANLLLAVTVSQIAGPFLLLPMLACGQILVMSSDPWIDDRPWLVVLWISAALLAPFGLVPLGPIPQTFHMRPEGLVVASALHVQQRILPRATSRLP